MKKRKISNTPNTFGGETICLNSKGGRNGVVGLQPSLKDRIYDSRGIACKELNRYFIGIEIDQTYFKIAEQRMA